MAAHQPATTRRAHRRFVFGDFEVDIDRGSLTREGRQVALRPKTFAVLLYLLEHAGQLVARDELLASVWSGLVVSDDALAQCLIELRRALGDETRSLIRTVPRRGLLLDVPVRFDDPAERRDARRSPTPLRHGLKLAAVLVLIFAILLWRSDVPGPAGSPVTSSKKTIVVLRFADMSAPSGHSWLADGFSEEIMHMLAQSSSLNVIARTSSFAIEGEAIDAIATRLGVSHVLEGSVRREDNQIRVAAQLIDADTSLHLWSKSFDREMDDLIELQKEIAGAVAQALETRVEEVDGAVVDPAAYELFLEARFFYMRRAEGDKVRAEKRLKDALAIDPEFARAWAALAGLAAARLGDPIPRIEDQLLREQLRSTQKHAAERALEFGPHLPEAHHRAAQYYFLSGQRKRALNHLEIARSIDPDHWLVRVAQANDLLQSGRVDESNRLIRLNVQRDPLNNVLRGQLLRGLLWAGRFEQVGIELAKLRDLNPSVLEEAPFIGQIGAQALVLQQDYDAALAMADLLPEGIERMQALAFIRHGQGRGSDTVLEQLASSADASHEMVSIAEIYAYRQESDQAMELLNRIGLENCGQDFVSWSIYYSPFLAMLDDHTAWHKYRSSVFAFMQSCRLGVQFESRLAQED